MNELIVFLKIKSIYNKFFLGVSLPKISELDETTAIDFAHMHINPEPQRYYYKDIHSYYSPEYVIGHFGIINNQHIRYGYITDEIKNAEKKINSIVTDTPLVLYRGVANQTLEEMYVNAKLYKDTDLYEVGFVHTSLVEGHEINHVNHLRIFVPQYSTCVYLGDVNYEQQFYEVVLQHGARFKLISVNNKFINLLYLPNYTFKVNDLSVKLYDNTSSKQIGKIDCGLEGDHYCINKYIVDPDYRNRGFGKALISIVIKKVIRTEKRILFINPVSDIWNDDDSPLDYRDIIRILQKLGFRFCDESIDVSRMKLVL